MLRPRGQIYLEAKFSVSLEGLVFKCGYPFLL